MKNQDEDSQTQTHDQYPFVGIYKKLLPFKKDYALLGK